MSPEEVGEEAEAEAVDAAVAEVVELSLFPAGSASSPLLVPASVELVVLVALAPGPELSFVPLSSPQSALPVSVELSVVELPATVVIGGEPPQLALSSLVVVVLLQLVPGVSGVPESGGEPFVLPPGLGIFVPLVEPPVKPPPAPEAAMRANASCCESHAMLVPGAFTSGSA